MFDVLPLSPVREWAISRSFTLCPHKADLRLRQLARQQDRRHRDHVARRLPRAAAGGRAVGIECFDLVADPDCLAEVFSAPGDADAHLIWFAGGRRNFRAVQGIDADKFETQFACGNTRQLQPFADNLQRQPSAPQRARAGIGDLPLADIAVDIADRDLQRIGTLVAAPATYPHAIRSNLLDGHFRKIRYHVRLEILSGVVQLVEQLLLAGPRRHRAPRARNLGDDETAVLADFTDRKTEPRQIGDILVAGVGEIAAGDLAGAFQQMPGNSALPQ